MRRFLVEFHVILNGKKIHAIRDVRRVTGMGITESKTFCEKAVQGYVDSFGGMLIANGDQVARMLQLDIESRNKEHLHAFSIPTYAVISVQEITHEALDVSANVL